MNSREKPLLDLFELSSVYVTSKSRMFLFDWDGTLTPIVDDPKAAIPTRGVLNVLENLALDPPNTVWIISGRDVSFLNENFGSISHIGLSAEHGAFTRRPFAGKWEDLSGQADVSWHGSVTDIFQEFTSRTPGSFIEKKSVAITWHYRKSEPEVGALSARECSQKLQNLVSKTTQNLEVMPGKMCLEVRPKNINKGSIVASIINDHCINHAAPGFTLCVGDDRTDEGKQELRELLLQLNAEQICFGL